MKRYALILVVLPAVAVAAGCGGSKSNTSGASPGSTVPPTSTSPASAKMNKHGTKNVSGASSVNVTMGDYFFSPTVIQGKPGQKLSIKLTNNGTVQHNFSIASMSISQNVQPQKTATVQVTLPKSGSVRFFCNIHQSLGMAGELTTGKAGPAMGATTPTTTSSNYGSGGY